MTETPSNVNNLKLKKYYIIDCTSHVGFFYMCIFISISVYRYANKTDFNTEPNILTT